MPRTLVGKIARLPEDIREQLNHRLLDNHLASNILPWLNDLAPVKEILAAQFKGAPINYHNLSNWRKLGYQRWFDARQSIAETKELAQFSAHLTAAGNGSIPLGASAIASGQILKRLQTVARAENENGPCDDLLKLTSASAVLLKGEQNNERIKIARERLSQHYIGLRLKRDKQQRNDAAVALRVLGDARAKAIEAAPWSHAEKIEGVGIHMFGPLWEPRPVPTPGSPLSANPHPPPAT
jgi:hypothetical protein